FGESVEAAAPAAAMPVALPDGVEFGLVEAHAGLARRFRERDGDEGLVSAAAVLAIPGEGVDQALGQHDLAQYAALPKIAAAAVGTQASPPGTSGPRALRAIKGAE